MVDVSNKQNSTVIKVTGSSGNTNITASSDTAQYWSKQSRLSAENSKESAQEAKEYAELANSYIENFEGVIANAETELTALKDAGVQEINTAVTDGKTELTTTKDLAIDAVNNTKTTILQDIEFVADGEKKEIEDLIDSGRDEIQELTNEIKDNASDIINRVSLSMFDTILKDHVLTYEESKGLALQGTYVYKNAVAGERYGYPDFYAKVIEEYNEATGTETVNGVSVKVHSNGHKFYDIANKTAIDGFFNTIGSAWFYGVDTANERIFLPRNNYFAINGVIDNVPVVGNGMVIGLTDGTNIGCLTNLTIDNNFGNQINVPVGTSVGVYGKTDRGIGVVSDPVKSGLIAQTSDVLKLDENKYLYICVGNTVSNTSWVDVVTQVEGGVKDLEDATNEGLQALSNASNALRQNQITNCLLEVPQNIKLELNNGTLTLKAGSIVTVPNGFEADGITPKFDYVTIESDKTFQGASGQTGSYIVSLQMANKSIGWHNGANAGSGTATTSTSGFYYRTDLNGIYYKNNTSTSKYCFPFCFVNISSGVITSIDQVFNGMGYIGSTIWVDKGVKGLIPNGRNEDGTYKSIEINTTKLTTITNPFGANPSPSSCMSLTTSGSVNVMHRYIESTTAPTTTYTTWFNPITNKIFYAGATAGEWIEQNVIPIASLNWTYVASPKTNTFTSLIPKQPFRAVDYNDKQEIISWGMPDYTAGVSFTSGKSFAQNGWLFIHCPQFVTATSTVKLNNILVYEKNDKDYNAGYHMVSNTSWIPYASNSVITTSGSFTSLIFYPAKGAN